MAENGEWRSLSKLVDFQDEHGGGKYEGCSSMIKLMSRNKQKFDDKNIRKQLKP